MNALARKLARCLPAPAHDGEPSGPIVSLEAAPDDALLGETRMTPYGTCHVITRRYDAQYRHGDRALRDFVAQPLAHLPTVTGDPRLEGLVARDALFLDIEATGLDHGAATLAFLVGVGRFEGDSFIVEQLVLHDPASERAMLHELVRLLDSRAMLVTFNGKSYDLTVLTQRLIMQRIWTSTECDLKLRPHLDLLHLSRNLEGRRLHDTRLGTLERELLGFFRVDDVPGHLVPACYYDHLRTGAQAPMRAVAEHNQHDVLSMVTLADHLIGRARPDPRLERHPAERDGLARLFLRRRSPESALALLSGLTQAAEPPAWVVETVEALKMAAVAARRALMPESARRAWLRLLERDPFHEEALRGLIRLESRGGVNLPRALELARRLEATSPSPRATRRVQRLRSRLSRAQGQAQR